MLYVGDFWRSSFENFVAIQYLDPGHGLFEHLAGQDRDTWRANIIGMSIVGGMPKAGKPPRLMFQGRGNGEPAFLQGYPLAVEPKIEYTARLWTNYHFYWLNWKNHGTKWAMASIRSFSRRLGG